MNLDYKENNHFFNDADVVNDARLNFCKATFEGQLNSIQNLNKRSQILLSFLTAILVSFFLKFEYLEIIGGDYNSDTLIYYLDVIRWGALVVLGVSCLLSLVYIFNSIKLRQLKNAHPDSMIDSLFSPESEKKYCLDSVEMKKYISMNYAVAVDDNKLVVEKKTSYIKKAHIATIICLLTLFIYICITVIVNTTTN